MPRDDASLISSVQFREHRSFKDVTLGLHPSMTILVGASGSGKTAALYGIYRVLVGSSLFSCTRRDRDSVFDASSMILRSGEKKPPLVYHEVDSDDGEDLIFWMQLKWHWDEAKLDVQALASQAASKLVGAEVHITSNAEGILFSVDGGPSLPLRSHPAGIRHLIKVAVGVTLRSARLDDPDGTRVVILDDVDRDLVPQLQVGLLGKLVGLFPGVQWVLSTRSPIIIGEAKPDMVRILDEGLVYYPGFTYGKSTVDVLSNVFSVQDRVEPVRTKIHELGRLCMASDLDAAENALQELTALLGVDDSALAVPRWELRLKRAAR